MAAASAKVLTFRRIDHTTRSTPQIWTAQQFYDYLRANYSKRSVKQIWDRFTNGRQLKFYRGSVTFELVEPELKFHCDHMVDSKVQELQAVRARLRGLEDELLALGYIFPLDYQFQGDSKL